MGPPRTSGAHFRHLVPRGRDPQGLLRWWSASCTRCSAGETGARSANCRRRRCFNGARCGERPPRGRRRGARSVAAGSATRADAPSHRSGPRVPVTSVEAPPVEGRSRFDAAPFHHRRCSRRCGRCWRRRSQLQRRCRRRKAHLCIARMPGGVHGTGRRGSGRRRRPRRCPRRHLSRAAARDGCQRGSHRRERRLGIARCGRVAPHLRRHGQSAVVRSRRALHKIRSWRPPS
mmetsp:Transcript_46577/g.143666  ORF Transcript_46577/g.143666 Transcript_46577/m.143666 type:complete len:232 (+) Transcript_46577:547-1242(+)